MNNINRRNFLHTATGLAMGTILTPELAIANEDASQTLSGLVSGQAKPLKHKSIPGFLSEQQLAPHYEAHYGGALRAYTDLDAKLEGSHFSSTVIDASAYPAMQRGRINKANSVLLHELYFDALALQTTALKPELRAAIEKRFASMDQWSEDFRACAKAASGWASLSYDPVNGKLYNIISDKHDSGVLLMAIPLLVVDVYEHAYYVDYKNNKTAYIDKFMQHINWPEVNRRYTALL